VALALAAKYPALPGKLVIVDSYPFFGGLAVPNNPGQGPENAAQMRQYMGAQTQDMYERYVKSGVATRMMVTRIPISSASSRGASIPTAPPSPTP